MIASVIASWMMCFFLTSYAFPSLMKLFSYKSNCYTHPAWVYVPGLLMWIVFFRTFPGQSSIVAGSVAVFGFIISMWWRKYAIEL